MLSSALTAFGVFAYQSGPNANVRPCLVLDPKPWMMGTRVVSVDGAPATKVFSVARSSRFTFSAKNPLPEGMSSGLPVLMIKHGTYRWLTSNDAERIVDSAEHILLRAAEQLDVENLMGTYPFETPPERTTVVTTQSADGLNTFVEVTMELVRPQAVIGVWVTELAKKRAEYTVSEARAAQERALQSGADLLDRDVADDLDFLLDDGKKRSPITGLRPDVTRYRGGTEYQVSVETFLKLLALARKGLR
jgi:hypothetical protein